MKLAFLDPVDWDYTPFSPLERPMGGSQSALCYLAPELAALGHEVTLLNNVSRPGIYAGVRCPGRQGTLTAAYLNQFDAVVGLNSSMGTALRARGVGTRLILWSQQATDQKDIQRLRNPDERAAWNAYVLVSDWQAQSYAQEFGIRPERVAVLRNAAGPVFQSLERPAKPFFRTGRPPVLVYTSTPFRGLLMLLIAFPMIRAAIPGCRLRVFSSMGVYHLAPEQEPIYQGLYALARDLPGVEYVGSVSQTALAAALAEADMLAYPVFAETSCIAVMEAMAAGCLVCTSNLGALPETTAGFGFLMDLPNDLILLANAFRDLLVGVYREAHAKPDQFEDTIARQRDHIRTQYSWAARAREWAATLPLVPNSLEPSVMKIAFVDLIDWDYTPLTPLEQPLGGSQSAAIYLARELAARGHAVTLFNRTKRPGIYAGIDCPGIGAGIAADRLNGCDAVVVMNSASGQRFRAAGVIAPLVLWSQHATDQAAVKALQSIDERRTWDRFVLVSQWQAEGYTRDFGILPERISVLRNAVSPPFEGLERRRRPFFRTGAPPVLAYTSTPFRGLSALLVAFPAIRAAIPDCRLRVYSSMGVYQVADAADEYRVLYDLARALPGSEYVGSLPQTALAEALAEADILAYPNTFVETSCISVMEAMAAGCLVVTTRLGALPETTAGFGVLMDAQKDVVAVAREFTKVLVSAVETAREKPDQLEDALQRQQIHARAAYCWAARAREWEQMLEPLRRRF